MQERRPYRVTDCPLRGPLSRYYLSGSSSPPPRLLSLKLQCVEVAGRNGFNGLINFDFIWHITEKPYMAHDLKREQYAFEFIFITGNSSRFVFFSLSGWLKSVPYSQEYVFVCNPQQNPVYHQIMGIRWFPCRNVQLEGKQLLGCEEGRRRLKGVNGG